MVSGYHLGLRKRQLGRCVNKSEKCEELAKVLDFSQEINIFPRKEFSCFVNINEPLIYKTIYMKPLRKVGRF
jgi:hypothetical protein